MGYSADEHRGHVCCTPNSSARLLYAKQLRTVAVVVFGSSASMSLLPLISALALIHAGRVYCWPVCCWACWLSGDFALLSTHLPDSRPRQRRCCSFCVHAGLELASLGSARSFTCSVLCCCEHRGCTTPSPFGQHSEQPRTHLWPLHQTLGNPGDPWGGDRS